MGADGHDDDGWQCQPLGLLIGLPFAALALVLSLAGAVVWILGCVRVSSWLLPGACQPELLVACDIGFSASAFVNHHNVMSLSLNSFIFRRSALSCVCPCCVCCAAAANLAVGLVQMPVKVIRWFIRQIPC
ncbi:hypothetical protein D1007_47957 [Hordeum vulgare]|nr:hypothetical protein D1007_47957 [Hordeum vulgare]